MADLKLLTHSRIKTARACQLRHHLRYTEGIAPVVEAEALRFGTLVHRGLEAWWKGVAAGTSGDDLLAAALDALCGEADLFERVRAEELVRGYHYRWLDTADRYEVLGVEVQFRAQLVNPTTGRASRIWELGGKLDVLVFDRLEQKKLLVEHKTTSEDLTEGSDYWKKLRLDGQVSIYYEGARSLGHDVSGCLYDVLRKPQLRPLKATPVEDRKYVKATGKLYANQREADETPEEFRTRIVEAIAAEPEKFYRRGDVVRLEGEVADAIWDVWQVAQQVHEAEGAGRWPRNPDACSGFGRTCEFFEVCTGAASLDDPARFKRLPSVHPELEAAPA